MMNCTDTVSYTHLDSKPFFCADRQVCTGDCGSIIVCQGIIVINKEAADNGSVQPCSIIERKEDQVQHCRDVFCISIQPNALPEGRRSPIDRLCRQYLRCMYGGSIVFKKLKQIIQFPFCTCLVVRTAQNSAMFIYYKVITGFLLICELKEFI